MQRRRGAALLLLAVLGAGGSATTALSGTRPAPPIPAAVAPTGVPAAPLQFGRPTGTQGSRAAPEPSAAARSSPGVSPANAPSGRPTGSGPSPSASSRTGAPAAAPDPRKFGFVAKGMSHEVMAFVTVAQLPYAVEAMDWDVVSTVAFFSLEATRDGTIAKGSTLRAWRSSRVDSLIRVAHANRSRVVISLKRFSWSPGQTAATRALLGDAGRRQRLATEVALEVATRGVDGVNVDFEPIPRGQREEFTDFVRRLRQELDRVAPGSQLTFCVTGHHESYDVAGATGPDGADAVYLMGYHYAGTWSSRAGSTAPMGGPRYDVVDTVRSLLREVEPHEVIVGVPFYGHAWPTAGNRLNAKVDGGGFDVTADRAFAIAARHGARYDRTEQVAWVPYRARPCPSCKPRWFQLYFDDVRAARHKWSWIRDRGLLGTGVWTIGFEGRPGGLTEALRDTFLVGPPQHAHATHRPARLPR